MDANSARRDIAERLEPARRDDREIAKGRPDGKAAPAGDTKEKPSLRERMRRHPLATAAIAIAIVLVLIGLLLWWLHARNYESTDDAFIDARTVTIASQLTGTIVNVPVTDNETVPAGAVLVEIDPRDYQAAVDQAKAQVDQANASIANYGAQIAAQQARVDAAQKQVVQAQAALALSQRENARAQDLVKRGAGTQQQADQTASDFRQKDAALANAQANQMATEKQIAVLQTQLQAARGQLEQAKATLMEAQANLARTRITAPETGRATKISAAVGNLAQPGGALMMFVPVNVWVTANFKETQLDLMRPGQPVDITVDAYPGKVFHGHVDSIQAGSGAAFSLLPPENATGNYVKVVQRVPVKIVFDGRPGVELGPGMSVVPTVKVR
ncbi:MAG TPA: HlyD family secretion protein [Xanthobacteraceae bacterium]|nr:HlyD family secretion protein [Xanthobacteraceae bacterium]